MLVQHQNSPPPLLNKQTQVPDEACHAQRDVDVRVAAVTSLAPVAIALCEGEAHMHQQHDGTRDAALHVGHDDVDGTHTNTKRNSSIDIINRVVCALFAAMDDYTADNR